MITQARPEYSSGATLAAGANLNASVMPHWPTAPVSATPPMMGQCSRVMGCHDGNAINVAPMASMQVIQNTMDCVLSVRPMIFTSTEDNE
jgi:hypothetical protein